MRRYLALCLSALMVFPGCASYTARPVPVPKIVAMPFSRIENSLMVAVDPYIQPDRQKEVFDADLKKLGVLPLYLLVENRGDQKIFLSRSDIALEVPDGRQISPVVGGTITRRLGELTVKPDPIHDPRVALVLLPVFLAIESAKKRAAERRTADYMNKEFQDVVLSKSASSHGFVYFMPPAGTLWFTKARLVLRFVDKTDGSSFVIRVPVSESSFKEGPVDTKKEAATPD